MDPSADPASIAPPQEPARSTSLPEIPGELGRTVLLIEFLGLALYWIAPSLYSSWNYAGTWSEVGYALFLALVGTLTVVVLRPLSEHLARIRSPRRNRWLFHGLWSGTLAAGLVATSLIQFGPAAAAAGSSSPMFQWTTTYTPFGAWPGVSLDLSSLGIFIGVNPPVLILLGIISILWAAVVVLRVATVPPACLNAAAPSKGWRAKVAAAVAAWGPVGFISGCPACSPAYLAVLGVLAPGAAASGYAVVPLVPWIGLAGLLFLGSLGLTLILLRRTTGAATELEEITPIGVGSI